MAGDINTLLRDFLANIRSGVWNIVAGGGTGSAGVGGVLTASTTSAQTGANTDETDLWTYTLPANTLSSNNYGVRVKAWGTTAANTNAKHMRGYFGATVAANSVNGAYNGLNWSLEWVVFRTGASAQLAQGVSMTGAADADMTIRSLVTTPAGDTTGAITIKVTGQNGTANAGDIVFRGAVVEFLRPGA